MLERIRPVRAWRVVRFQQVMASAQREGGGRDMGRHQVMGIAWMADDLVAEPVQDPVRLLQQDSRVVHSIP